jgi:hypothetical protein
MAESIKIPLLISLLLMLFGTGASALSDQKPVQPAQFTPLTFNAWRPYKNPEQLVQIGMNKGQVLAIAGKPDYEESYYQGPGGRWSRISDWYYIKNGLNKETALVKFVGDTLVTISVTPIQ